MGTSGCTEKYHHPINFFFLLLYLKNVFIDFLKNKPYTNQHVSGVKGHIGVKNVHYTKNATHTDYVTWPRDLCMW